MKRAAAALVLAGGLLGAREAGAQCKGRPTDAAGYAGYTYAPAEVKSFAGARVRVHYATSGQHAPALATTRGDGVPDTVAMATSIGDEALDRYAKMGFRAIPSDASCASNGGDDKVDVYLVKFAGADGTTVPDACNGSSCSSFVLSEATFAGRGYANAEEGFKTVVTHELFHAVQNVYDPNLDRFWAEGTAQWAMKTVHPELADFERNLPAFFAEPTRSLDTQPSGATATYLYGSAVWPLFLTLKYDPDLVRLVFEEEAKGQKSLVAVDAVLKTKGSSLADAYPLFGAWNAATKGLAGEGGYPDAAKYPGIKTLELADGAKDLTSGLAYVVYRGTLDGQKGVSLETDAERNAGVLVPIEGGKANVGKAQKLPANGSGEVLVVVAGITTKKTDAPYTIRIGAPVAAPSSASSSSGGSSSGGGDDGGCALAPRAETNDASTALPVLGAALALGLARARRRPR